MASTAREFVNVSRLDDFCTSNHKWKLRLHLPTLSSIFNDNYLLVNNVHPLISLLSHYEFSISFFFFLHIQKCLHIHQLLLNIFTLGCCANDSTNTNGGTWKDYDVSQRISLVGAHSMMSSRLWSFIHFSITTSSWIQSLSLENTKVASQENIPRDTSPSQETVHSHLRTIQPS